MELFQRQKLNEIEGINIRDLTKILNRESVDSLPEVDTVVFDTILLTDGTKIKCVKNYYQKCDGSVPLKGKAHNTCVAIQRFYDAHCAPYSCSECHRILLAKRKNKRVQPR